jgi:HPt (histidine-containing phosphotransfer) domain-containing protein
MISPTTTKWVFNRTLVLEQIGHDESLMLTIIEVFLVDSPDIRQRLLDTLATGNPDALGAMAHCAKSAVGNFFADVAVQAAMVLENACKAKQTEQLKPLTQALYQALIETEDVLRLELQP